MLKKKIFITLKSSETLFSISGAYSVTVEELRAWNHLNEQDVLDIGQSLLIKKSSGSNMSDENSLAVNQYKTHTVKQEDTLYSIARQYDISIKELMDLNNKESFTIKEGEELKIKAIN